MIETEKKRKEKGLVQNHPSFSLFAVSETVTKECTTPHKLGLQLVGDFLMLWQFLCIC